MTIGAQTFADTTELLAVRDVSFGVGCPEGGAYVAGARGVLVLARQPDGSIVPLMHNLLDPRTGAARMPLRDDPAMGALTLVPCAGDSFGADLRGRDDGGAGS